MRRNSEKGLEMAMFGAGCFWGVEDAFMKIKGVKETAVGYAGGDFKNPTYRDVCSGGTGHVEVVQVKFDVSEVSFEELLGVFWEIHDSATFNRQGRDVGSQYRSAIFYYSDAQKSAALESKAELEKSGRFKRPIVTEIKPAGDFYRAEDYHQQYFLKRGGGSCHV